MSDKQIRVSAYALLVEDNRILLCRCSPQSDDPGQWTLPGGGLDFGEPPEDAARREVFEETGLEVELENLVAVTSRSLPAKAGRAPLHWVRIIYKGRIIGGTLRAEINGSTDKPAWINREEVVPLPLVELAEQGLRLAFAEYISE